MTLTKHYIVRARDGRHLDASGMLTNQRPPARLIRDDAVRCLSFPSATHWSDPMFGLSIEEVSKRERRLHQPMTTDEVEVMRALMLGRVQRARVDSFLKAAAEARRLADYYEAQAQKLAGTGETR